MNAIGNIGFENLNGILRNKSVRKRLAYEDPLWFCLIYLRHYFQYPLAPFHMEMLHLLKNEKYTFIAVMAFRESGKSTIMNMVNVLWSILGEPQKRFVVIVSQTQEQAKNHFSNILEELKSNDALRDDFGPFADNEAEWKKTSLELVYHEAKVLSVSREQSIRGIRYGSLRPDLIICDDLEDGSARNDKTKRDEMHTRFITEILPLGSSYTRIVTLGNLICDDSLMMRLKQDIKEGRQAGIFRAYPIMDYDRKILWPGKFNSMESIKELWKKFPKVVWAREFVLKLLYVNDDGSEPKPITMEIGRSLRPGDKIEEFVYIRQKALIPAMEEFNIPLPEAGDETPIPIFGYRKSGQHRYMHCNIDLDKPLESFK
ncbi:MAG: hypothetical protein Q8P07_01490 [bacterium]|nr:hypothetical protein [bacterium]